MNQFELIQEQVLTAFDTDGSPDEALVAADFFEEKQAIPLAASAMDRAFGLDRSIPGLVERRSKLLESLTIVEHGIRFRYVPAGTFLMGSQSGDRDEQPVHPVQLNAYWISETPITWATFADLMDWNPPPAAYPKPPVDEDDQEGQRATFTLMNQGKIRLQYCESDTKAARDWHAHQPDQVWSSGETSEDIFGKLDRGGSTRPLTYDSKPLIAVAHQDATQLAEKLSTDDIQYRLPTEAEWEKAARGGLIGCRFSWGNAPPSHELCDFDHFGDFYIGEPKSFPPNGYGLRGMCGGVWEWTCDPYDSLAYSNAPMPEQPRPSLLQRVINTIRPSASGEEVDEAPVEHVVRGGSWSDCGEACTVSFRKSLHSQAWDDNRRLAAVAGHSGNWTPNVGFRLVRIAKPGTSAGSET